MKTITVNEGNALLVWLDTLNAFQTMTLATITLMVACYLIAKWG